MASYKPVIISKGAFAFCRYGVAIIVWLSLLLHATFLLGFVCGIFLLSAILKVKKAPMILIYDYSLGRIIKSEDVMVNENAIFFAHTAGFIVSFFCLLVVCFSNYAGAWFFVLGFALLKTVSALGFCPASKLYDCALQGNCCVNKKQK